MIPPRRLTAPKSLHRQSYLFPPGTAASDLIADRKALAEVRRPLDFVGECSCEVLIADPALAVGGGQELVAPEPELAGLFPRHEQGGRRDEGPVQLVFAAQQVKEGTTRLGLRLVLGREV